MYVTEGKKREARPLYGSHMILYCFYMTFITFTLIRHRASARERDGSRHLLLVLVVWSSGLLVLMALGLGQLLHSYFNLFLYTFILLHVIHLFFVGDSMRILHVCILFFT